MNIYSNETSDVKKPHKKKRLIILSISAVIIVLLYIWGFLMETVGYEVSTDKLSENVRIVFISDLHNCFFGGFDQSGIMDEIDKQQPDIVLFGGDVIDFKGGTKYSLRLMKMVEEKYPCAYACGNHEMMRSDYEEFFSEVEKLGIPIVHGTYTELNVKEQKIRVYGIADADEYGFGGTQLENCYSTLDNGYYNILLAHQPEQYRKDMALDPEYSYLKKNGDEHFDLILSGHAHGGQWRIPYILDQGLYAPDQGLFPERTTGMYTHGDTTQIVSRGLAKPLRMIFIPRIFNRPELTVVDLEAE